MAITLKTIKLTRQHYIRTWFSAFFIIVGLSFIGQSFYIHAKAWLAQVLLEQAWNKIQQGETQVKPWPWADTWPVARLQVPSLNIDLFILAGDSARNLAFGPGHNFASAQPGDVGNSIISAHRDTHFSFLQQLKDNDIIIIESSDRLKKVFHVNSSRIVHKDKAGFIFDDINAHIHLVTCYPFNSIISGGSQRYIISATAI